MKMYLIIQILGIALASSIVSADNKWLCEWDEFRLSCPSGSTITIDNVLWGRWDYTYDERCYYWGVMNTTCRSEAAVQQVKDRCESKDSCYIWVTNWNLGGDPCIGTFKYLDVDYRCVAPCELGYKPNPALHIEGGTPVAVDTLNECHDECDKDNSCFGFDFQESDTPYKGYHCWLHNDKTFELSENPNVDHYSRQFCNSGAGCKDTFIKTAGHQSDRGTHAEEATTPEACNTQCENEPMCVAYDWNSKDNQWGGCWVYTFVDFLEDQEDTTFFFRETLSALEEGQCVM